MSDLFGFLRKMNEGDFRYVDRMGEEETKKLSPFVLLMWCNGAERSAPEHTVLTNTYVNEYVFPLGRHPKLLHKLFVAANGGVSNTRYKFKKSVTKEEVETIRAISYYYQCSYREAKDYASILKEKDIEEMKKIYSEVK